MSSELIRSTLDDIEEARDLLVNRLAAMEAMTRITLARTPNVWVWLIFDTQKRRLNQKLPPLSLAVVRALVDEWIPVKER